VIGALAITIANPTDLVKVRLQSEGQLPSGVPKRYSGAMDAYSTIIRQVRVYFDVFFVGSFICKLSLIM
jgi:solute carrier family 25 uncoupling protein 8/9